MTTGTETPADDPELDDLLFIKLWSLGMVLERRLAAELAPLGLTVASFRLIGELMREPEGLRQGELANRLGVRPPTVSTAVTRLEQAGLVTRIADPDDPRARRVRLAPDTPLDPGLDLLRRLDDTVSVGLDDTERQRLGQQLDDLMERLTR